MKLKVQGLEVCMVLLLIRNCECQFFKTALLVSLTGSAHLKNETARGLNVHTIIGHAEDNAM
jgi:hypothetical protein